MAVGYLELIPGDGEMFWEKAGVPQTMQAIINVKLLLFIKFFWLKHKPEQNAGVIRSDRPKIIRASDIAYPKGVHQSNAEREPFCQV